MTRAEFAAEFRKLLAVCNDNYISSNLKNALDIYEAGAPLPPKKVFSRDPREICTHGQSLNAHCDTCMESYGSARTVMGDWIDPTALMDEERGDLPE